MSLKFNAQTLNLLQNKREPLDYPELLAALETNYLTTGAVAKLFSVAARTVTKWFDTGKIGGYRVPGSKDRRIPKEAVAKFMVDNRIPVYSSHLMQLHGIPVYAKAAPTEIDNSAAVVSTDLPSVSQTL